MYSGSVEISDADGSTEVRPYRSALRAQQAELTRSLIVAAARESFLENGWAATSVRGVAAAAGVSEATVYGVFGNKAGLATALIDGVDEEADVARASTELDAATGDPTGQLAAVIGFDRRLFERGGGIIATIIEGRRDYAELDAAYQEGRRRGDAVRREVFGSWSSQVWRDGMDPERALDVYAATCSIMTFDVLHQERGWSPVQIESWWNDVLGEQFFG